MGGGGGWVILRVFSLFLCPPSMTTGQCSFLLPSLGGAYVTHARLRPPGGALRRSDWLRALRKMWAILGCFAFDVPLMSGHVTLHAI